MKLAVITIFLLTQLFSFLLKYLNYRNRNATVPQNVSDIYDNETYIKRNAYEMEKLKISIISGVCALLIDSAFLIFNGFSFLFNFIADYTANIYLQSLFVFGSVLVFSGIIEKAFGAYETFNIESRYGFNKTSVKTFAADTAKTFIISTVVASGLFFLFLYLYTAYGNRVFIVFYVLIIVIIIFMVFTNHFFSKLFNKFTQLEDGALKDRINKLASEAGFPVRQILVMNASKRSSKLNAYFTGFGSNKRIVLYDTLLEKMSDDEVLAVLAHEIGHAKYRHLLKKIPVRFVVIAVYAFLAQFLVGRESISLAFGFLELNVAFGVYIFFITITPIAVVLSIPNNYISRSYERAGDRFAAQFCGKDNIISALKKLARENYSSLTPHPFVVLMHYTHPPLSQRIADLESLTHDQLSDK